MDLFDSINFLFSVQSVFLLSVLKKTTFKPSNRSIQISIVCILCMIGILFYRFYVKREQEVIDDNLQGVTSYVAFGCQLLIWVMTIFYRKRESQFYLELVNIDKILQLYGSLEQTYQKFSVASRTVILPILVEVCIGLGICWIYKLPMTIESLLLLVAFIYLSGSLFIYTFVFYFNIKLLRDRFQLIKDLTQNCYKMEEFEDLEKAHKGLIALMDGVNDSIGVKLGFVLLSNFLSAVLTSYNVFVSFIVPSRGNYLFYIFSIIFPNIIMLFMNFLSGEWITTDVSARFDFIYHDSPKSFSGKGLLACSNKRPNSF